jgi:tetratricopeptide (TPR) repeat protein
MRCLDARLDELRNLASVYAGAVDREAAVRALEAAHALDPVTDCDDLAALGRAVPLPGDPKVRAAVDELEARLRTVKTLTEVGRHHDALAAARALDGPARTTAYAPIEARVAFTIGRLESINGDSKAGLATLHDALAIAGGVADDELFVDVLGELVYVTGYEAARTDEALALGTVLEPYLDRKTIADDARATALSHLGVVRWAKGDLAGAEARFAKALALDERAHGKEWPRLSPILDNLGNVASDARRPAEALGYYDRSLALVRKAYGEDHPDVARTLLDRGTELQDLGRVDDAIADFRRAMAIWEAAYGPRHSMIAAAANDLGEALSIQHRWDEALAACERARAIGDATLPPDHPIHAYHLLCVARAELGLGRAADAIPLVEQAIAIRQASGGDLGEAQALLARARAASVSSR